MNCKSSAGISSETLEPVRKGSECLLDEGYEQESTEILNRCAPFGFACDSDDAQYSSWSPTLASCLMDSSYPESWDCEAAEPLVLYE